MPEFAQALVESRVDWRRPRLDCYDADVQIRRPLCSRHERPRDHATERGDQFSSSNTGWHVLLPSNSCLARRIVTRGHTGEGGSISLPSPCRHVGSGSISASPVTARRGSYTSHNGHEGGRSARLRWANRVTSYSNKTTNCPSATALGGDLIANDNRRPRLRRCKVARAACHRSRLRAAYQLAPQTYQPGPLQPLAYQQYHPPPHQ